MLWKKENTNEKQKNVARIIQTFHTNLRGYVLVRLMSVKSSIYWILWGEKWKPNTPVIKENGLNVYASVGVLVNIPEVTILVIFLKFSVEARF